MDWIKPLIDWLRNLAASAAGAYLMWLHGEKEAAKHGLETRKKFDRVAKAVSKLSPADRDDLLRKAASRKR